MLQLPPIPTSILGLSDIEVERAEISHNGEFIITVKSTQKEVKCKKCNKHFLNTCLKHNVIL